MKQLIQVPRNALSLLIDMAKSHIEDIDSGIEDGTYLKSENKDLETKRKAVVAAEEIYRAAAMPQHVEKEMKKFTVIAVVTDSGQIVCHHVEADSGLHAFLVLAQKESCLDMVVAIPGHLKESDDITFPGEALVDSETILDQPDVFGAPDVSSSNSYLLNTGLKTSSTHMEGQYVCKHCKSSEVSYNSGVNDALCASCGKWQNGEEL